MDSGIKEENCLFSLVDNFASRLLDSRSDNTVKKYTYGFDKWRIFANNHSLNIMPASPVHVALCIVSLLDNGATYSSVTSIVYSIKWAHEMNGLTDPTDNGFVKNLLESAKRTSKSQMVKKDPVTHDMLINLCGIFYSSSDLTVVRDLTMILLAYSAFLRFNELSNLKCSDIEVKDDYLCIKISKSKTDQYRHGDEVLVSKGQSIACPYAMFLKYVSVAQVDLKSNLFLFRPIYRSKHKCALINVNKPISYTTARECIIKKLKLVAPNLNLGLHSLRSGGASAAANAHVDDRCWKRHGRWKSESSKDGYVADSVENRLKVSKHLGI